MTAFPGISSFPPALLLNSVIADASIAENHRMNKCATLTLAGLLLCAGSLSAQRPLDLVKVVEALEKDGRVALDKGKVLALK